MKKRLWQTDHTDTLTGTPPTESLTDLNQLIDLIDEPESEIYQQALARLRSMGDNAIPTLLQMLSESAGFRAVPIIWLLADIGGSQAIDMLHMIVIYSAEPGDDQLADEAAHTLEAQGQLSHDRLIDALTDPRAKVRARAAWYLHWGIASSSAREHIVAAVMPLANDPDEHVRHCAAITLHQSGDARVIPALLTILRQATTATHKIAVLQALKQMPDRRAVADCLTCLDDEDKWVRACAAGALGAVGDSSALVPLLNALADAPGQPHAAEALSRLENVHEAADSLLEVVADPAQPVALRARAAEIMGKIGDRRVRPILSQLAYSDDEHLRFAALTGLSKLGDPESVRILIEHLANDTGWVRRGAIELFAALKNAQAVDPLIRELEQETQPVELYFLVLALHNQGSPRAVRPLRDLLTRTHPANKALLQQIHAAIDALKTSQYD